MTDEGHWEKGIPLIDGRKLHRTMPEFKKTLIMLTPIAFVKHRLCHTLDQTQVAESG